MFSSRTALIRHGRLGKMPVEEADAADDAVGRGARFTISPLLNSFAYRN